MTVFVCVHGHAYQPPREDPVTGEVPLQPSAAPFHDWNERITDECYRPFGTAVLHVPGEHHQTLNLNLNLWERVSFDLGPTLGVWMDRHTPDVSTAIGDGDAVGGGAMAHPWVHAILPLTPAADRATVVRWGVDEFQARFGRRPTSMWLPETAVDTASLEALADAGIDWVLLAPHQVVGVDGSPAPVGIPLSVPLPSGRPMAVVPYDGELSHSVAFGGLLDDGTKLAHAAVERGRSAPAGSTPLVILATDLETFGHHHRFGEMALAKAYSEWDAADGVEVITPTEYLRRFGADLPEGRLVERSSWSCAHGVERWRSDCGCRMEHVDGVDQAWRQPLRDLLDGVTDVCARLFDAHAGEDLADPWAARHDYGVVLSARPDQTEHVRRHFLAKHLAAGGSPERAWGWMEAERLRLEAWSSCAWFFDSPDRIETIQTLNEARAALTRYADLTGTDATGWFDAQALAAGLTPGFGAT